MNILFVIDGSGYVETAVRLLRHLNPPSGSCITVVAVAPKCPDSLSLDEMAHRNIEVAGEACMEAATRLASEVATLLSSSGWQTNIAVFRGHPANEIVKASGQVDLVVLSAKGRDDAERCLLGDVAQKVLRYASSSVLLIRPAAFSPISPESSAFKPMPLQVLAAVDGSANTATAFTCFSHFHLSPRTEITVAHVIKRISILSSPRIPVGCRDEYVRAMQDIREEEDAKAARIVSAAQETFTRNGTQVDTLVIEGKVAEQLILLTQKRKPHLIVVGSKGLTGVLDFRLGSVSQKVAKYGACSVLVTRIPRRAHSLCRR